MSDDVRSSTQPGDRINLHQEHDIRDWSQSLGVTAEQLREAIAIVGNNASTVREYLRSRKGS